MCVADEAVTLDVGGMTCDGCAGKVRNALESVSGVLSAVVSHESGSAVVSHSGISRNLMADAVREIGYTVDGRAEEFHWRDGSVWNQSAYNTMWCLIGCSIGDLGTIAYFQFVWTDSGWTTMAIMMLAIMNGLLTSIALETVILLKQLPFRNALRTAAGMSLISMIAMEAAMNITDIVLTGGAMLTWYAIIPMWIAGFLTPWPYNYWRLKKYGVACH
jgi:copper chaperone CopZ|tara:strand:+ start:2878 stop:3528 length:651 start_codon:yes stop_codon:yes gene_type:complete